MEQRAADAPADGRPAGVVFDVDGTLVDTTYLHAVTWWEAFREGGHQVPMANIHRAVGMGSDHLLDHLLPKDRDRDADDALQAAHAALFGTYRERLVPLPGAADLMRACAAAGQRVVLASSAKPPDLAAMRRALGADDVVAAATGAADVEHSKPDPDIVQVALDRSGLAAHECVFVGDSVWDVQASARLAMPCVGLTCGGTSAAELLDAGAVAAYETPADLLAHLEDSPLRGDRR